MFDIKLSIGILSGGKSTRMGSDKSLLKLNQETFLNRIITELNGFDEQLVSVDSMDKYSNLSCYCVEDEYKEVGPIEGIRQILNHARNDYVFICATDMPFLKKELVEYMKEFISRDYDCYVLEDDKRKQPLCAIYSKRVGRIIEQMLDEKNYRLLTLLNRCNTKYIPLSYTCFDPKIVRNINTKEDYKRALKPIVFCVSGVKNSGKTHLIERMIHELAEEFPRIGVVKHDGHDFTIDRVGTDTYRFIHAGATMAGIYSKEHSAVMSQQLEKKEIDIIASMEDMDLIILEGLKYSEYPKLELVKDGISKESVCQKKGLIAIATDLEQVDNADNIRLVNLNDTKKLVNIVLDYFEYN